MAVSKPGGPKPTGTQNGPSERQLARASHAKEIKPPMRNETKGTTPRHSTRTAPPNAFSQAFLLKAARLEDLPSSAPTPLTAGGFWAGPWEIEQIDVPHDLLWAVVRRGEAVAAGGRAVAVTRHRSDAVLLAATLSALAVPNHLRLGEKSKRLGFPIHDGDLCVGHLSRPDPRIIDQLHTVRTLMPHPESLAFAVESLGSEDLPILGRALMRRIEVA